MIKKVIGTIFTRFLSAVVTLLIVILAANAFGPSGMGDISLVILAITIILVLSNFVGGGALIYLIPRHKLSSVFFLSYVWALVSCVFSSLVLGYFGLLPKEFFLETAALSILFALSSVNLNILIAREKINTSNILSLAQIIFQIVSLFILIQIQGKQTIAPYIMALFISWGLIFLAGLVLVLRLIDFGQKEPLIPLLKKTFKFGSYVQFANIIQLLNYRLSYYLLNIFSGKSVLGNYSIGVQLSEGLWIVSKSIATVQYSNIANNNDLNRAKQITLLFFKISLILTLFGTIVLALIPESVYVSLFGAGFISVKKTILLLSPGILAVACYSIFSHYFSGIGKHYFNTLGSLAGFAITAGGGFYLIPRYGLEGAAITASLSYVTTFVFQLVVFLKLSGAKTSDFLVTSSDISGLSDIITFKRQ